MRLVIATDHAFFRTKQGVFDTFCINYEFFDDYRQIFDEVDVVARVNQVEALPVGAFRSDGEGVRFIDVPNIRGMGWLLRAARLSKHLLTSAVELSDAVIVRVPSELGWLAARCALRMHKPYMVEVIGDPRSAWASVSRAPHYKLVAWFQGLRLRYLTQHAVAGSYVEGRHLPRVYPLRPGTPQDSISSIRLKKVDVLPSRQFYERPVPLRVIHVGTLTRRKRGDDLIRACHVAVERGLEVQLQFVGDGPQRPQLEALRDKLRMGKRVVFHGHIADRELLNHLLDDSDLFVMTSASEGLPRAMIEAMARGLPVAGSRIPGIDELVRDSELFPLGDVYALGNLLWQLGSDPERLTAMSSHSTSIALQYTDEFLSPKRIRLYQALADKSVHIATQQY